MRVRALAVVKPRLGRVAVACGLVACLSALAACGPRLDGTTEGFSNPESVLHDTQAGVYLVSSINQNPRVQDNNGFISRVSLDGKMENARFIAAGQGGVELHAPKGMALSGQRLFVADLTVVRVFDRATGAPAGVVEMPEARVLNGVTAGPDGTVYVTDTSWDAESIHSTGSDTVFTIGSDLKGKVLCRGRHLEQPNGIWVDASGVYLASWSTGELSRLEADCKRTVLTKFESSGLDGLVRNGQGDFLVSSWHGRAIYRYTPGSGGPGVSTGTPGTTDKFFEHRAMPGIGYDASRDRLLIPFYELGKIGFRDKTSR